MKRDSINIKLTIFLFSVLLVALFYSTSVKADINEEVARLKYRYETLYKKYTQNLTNYASSDRHALAQQLAAAKREYERALEQLRLSKSKRDKIKDNLKKVGNKLKDVFNNGLINHTEYTAANNEKILPGFATATVNIQGNNYCGQYATVMVLRGMGIPVNDQEVYKQTNPAGIFTSAPVITEYLQMHGLKASSKQKASIDDIIKNLDEGKPVIALVNADGTPHWVTIIGYKKRSDGKISQIMTRDSYWGVNKTHSIDIEEFKKIWKTPNKGIFGYLENYSNFMISIDGRRDPAFSPPAYPSNFWTVSEDNFGSGINDTVSGFKNFSPIQLAGGLTKLWLGVPGSVLAVSSNTLFKGSDKTMNWGKSKFKESGFFNKLIGGATMAISGAAKAVAAVGRGVASVISSGATLVGNGIKKLEYVFAR